MIVCRGFNEPGGRV